MDFEKIGRIPKRIKQDLQIIGLAQNWQQILSSKLKRQRLPRVELRNGVVINAPAEVDLQFLFKEIWLDEIYCPAGYKIKNENIIIDIGANIGVFATYAATRARNVQVIAFEPFPKNAEWLRRNVSESNLLSKIKIHQQAVAGVTENRTLQASDSWILHSLSETSIQKSETVEEEADGIRVECISFNDVMKSVPRCDLLKIDCEGSEYEIFYSTPPEILKKVRRIVGEFHLRDEDQKNGKALCGYLESQGFDITDFTMFDNKEGVFCATNSHFFD